MKPAETVCPITKVAKLLSDTWTMLIMHTLLTGSKRFCDLERELAGISTRTLTLKLAKLADEGLLHKLPNGSYAATERGRGLKLIEAAMKKYGEKYL